MSHDELLVHEKDPYKNGQCNCRSALEGKSTLVLKVSGLPAVPKRDIPGFALRAFPGCFQSSSEVYPGISSRSEGSSIWVVCLQSFVS